MSRLRMAAVAACSFFTLSSVQAVASEAKQCWHPYEVEAAKVRDLHVMLMLGALRCKAANKDMMGKYEAFTASKSGLLNSYNNVLKTRFMRVNGISDAQRAYEAFNTRLGNSHSGLAQAASYCAMTDTLLTLAASANDRELPQLATSFSESALGIDTLCEPPAAAVTAPATAAPHEAITATQAAPATVAVAKPEEAVTEPVSAVAALEAAAVALQNAAASLKAQSAAPEATESADKPVTAAPEASPAVPQPVTAKAAPTG
ncbi:hypothetical protein BV98_001858 [Sphingobium herbicidovorans NBRC 16415]|uniref:Uncharacterized protein n=1 Tax=Sphingobium herbicidovorans (strain ATCC 700291 / DSM 11019 / CCUG 56400 / KCTC 2939 / LMG 18315 / NBRC 16415 / MH) TaxID=1219045 RepID=A0A086PB86_SPHHM|nr:hypothetical protein [Sphingobium herbicidovorans]KFG90654.1 hypothetical protein BV98_001858 [Sphingobium herbicidovorans NBRC 16415]